LFPLSDDAFGDSPVFSLKTELANETQYSKDM